MKKILLLLTGMILFSTAWADNDLSALLNKVSFPLRAEKWVTTTTAAVYVGVNASVSDAGIEKIQSQTLGQLQRLSNQGEWHIISYNRQEDKSGLESIQIRAEARLPQTELTNLRSRAKSISKPGNTFTIDDVQFSPSNTEITAANVLLRGLIYLQAKAEVDALNKLYPEQKYYLHRVEFVSTSIVMPMMAMSMKRNQGADTVNSDLLNVGNKMEMMANITVASMPDILAKKPLIN